MIIDFTKNYIDKEKFIRSFGELCPICKEYYLESYTNISCTNCCWCLQLYRAATVKINYLTYYGATSYTVLEDLKHNTIGTNVNMNPFRNDGKALKWVNLVRGTSVDLRKLICMLKRDVPRQLAYRRK